LYSLLYSLVEIYKGALPWRDAGKNRPVSLSLRFSNPPEKLFKKCPRQFLTFHRIIASYGLFETPNYDLLIALLCEAMAEGGCAWTDPYDWEMFSAKQWKKLTPIDWTIPDNAVEPNIPTNIPEIVVPDGEIEEFDNGEDGDSGLKAPVCGGCSLFLCGC
jgi:hypothetical protein